MERAQREADGPRRRILEAAKVKGTVKTPEPATTNPVAPTAPPPATTAAAPAAAAPKPVPKDEAPPDRLLVTQPLAVERVALPASGVAPVPTVAKTELAPAGVSLATLPQPVPSTEPLAPPRLLSKVDPELPSRLQRRLGGRRIEVVADVIVQLDGSVTKVTLRSPAEDDLAEAVRDALQQWRYEPQPEQRLHTVRLVFAQPN